MQLPRKGLQRRNVMPRNRGHHGHYHPGYTFIPASVGTYGYLGKPLVRYLNPLSEVAAAQGPAVTKGSFPAGAHRELSMGLIKCLCIVVLQTSWRALQAVRCRQELRSPMRTDVECAVVALLLALGAVG